MNGCRGRGGMRIENGYEFRTFVQIVFRAKQQSQYRDFPQEGESSDFFSHALLKKSRQ
jgi:hypothetical protein